MPRIATDIDTLKPILEALIFASEEPLSARFLARLINGDRDPAGAEGATDPPLVMEMADDAEEASEISTEPEADDKTSEISTEPEADGTGAEQPNESDQPAAAGDNTPPAVEEVPMPVERRGKWSVDARYIQALVGELNRDYEESARAFRIVEVAGGFQFATTRDFGEVVALLSKEKSRRRLSPAALETLAIIAYRQPVSKPEVESIRGVNCDQVLLNLMEKNLVAITGRSEGVGRPLLYGTTADFLRTFGLKGISDLPKLREIEELMEQDVFSAERADVITLDSDTDVEEIEARVGAAGHTPVEEVDHLPVDEPDHVEG